MAIFNHNTLKQWTRVGGLLAVAVFFLCQSGCVQRRLLVNSNPPGALVYVDDQKPIGVTPCACSPIYYGQRKIRLEKEGYETQTRVCDIQAPWYEWFGLDFISENLVPGQIQDNHPVDFTLTPQTASSPEQIRVRGEELRQGIHSSTHTQSQLVPPPPTGAAPSGVPTMPSGVSGMPSGASAAPTAPYSPSAPAAPYSPAPTTSPSNNIGSQPSYALPSQ
jgi:hypothetical protein